MEAILAAAPNDGIAEESGDPKQERKQILKRQQQPEAKAKRRAKHESGRGPSRQGAEAERRDAEGPPSRPQSER
jgi:hypothetical protein